MIVIIKNSLKKSKQRIDNLNLLFLKFYYFFIKIFFLKNYNFKKNNLSFEDIVNKNYNKVGICIAKGPSLNIYLNKLKNCYKNKKDLFCFLAVNDYESVIDFDVDYRVVANSVFTILNEHKRFNKKKQTRLLYSDSVDTTNDKIVNFLLDIEYLNYDQRHFNGQKCIPVQNCCKKITPRFTIQEYLKNYCKTDFTYSSGSTVALHLLAFSILMGCKNIFLFGVDLDYKLGYANPKLYNDDSFDPYLQDIMNDFKIINQMAKNIGVNVYNTSYNSPLNKIFEFKNFLHYETSFS
jgi:hypothetical protein